MIRPRPHRHEPYCAVDAAKQAGQKGIPPRQQPGVDEKGEEEDELQPDEVESLVPGPLQGGVGGVGVLGE